jgi:hypothetical protein
LLSSVYTNTASGVFINIFFQAVSFSLKENQSYPRKWSCVGS